MHGRGAARRSGTSADWPPDLHGRNEIVTTHGQQCAAEVLQDRSRVGHHPRRPAQPSRASRWIRAAGRGRLGALGAEKPARLCVPSQKGLIPDLPQRHSAIVSRPGSMSTPSWSTSRKSPRTINGPSRYGVIVGPPRFASSWGGSGTGRDTVLPCPEAALGTPRGTPGVTRWVAPAGGPP